MDLRDMKWFYTIAEEGSISSAAKRMNIAQPALSRQMKLLEEQLGIQLFERGSRNIRLTQAGYLLKERAEQIINLTDGTIKELKEIDKGVSGTLSIGAITTSGAAFLPATISAFHNMYPDVNVQIWEGDVGKVFELLDNRVIEIGIIREPFELLPTYASAKLPSEQIFTAMRRDRDPSSGVSTELYLRELENTPILILRRWKGMFIRWCEQVGFVPQICCESDSIVFNILLAKAGMGVAIVPKYTQSVMSDPTLVYKTIVRPNISTQSHVIWLKNSRLSMAGTHFLKLLSDQFS